MEAKVAAYLHVAQNDTSISYADVRANVKAIVEGMTVAELKTFAGLCRVGLYKASKTTMQESFAREIVENKCSHDRCQFTLGGER